MNKKVVVSACLAGQSCRYDGGSNSCSEVIRLIENGLAVPLCPEQLGGLSTPRSPCELHDGKVWSRDGHDCTAAFELGAERALHLAQDAGCTMAILKTRSPSCGANGVYDGTFTKHLVTGEGLWARALRQAGFRIFTDEDIECGGCKAPHLPIIAENIPHTPYWRAPQEGAVRLAFMVRKHLFCREQAIQGSGKSRIDGHLHDDLQNLFACAAHLQRSRQMHLQLWAALPSAVNAVTTASSRVFRSNPGRE